MRLIIALVIAFAALVRYDSYRVDVEQVGQLMANQSTSDTWRGKRITSRDPAEMLEIINERSANGPEAGQDLILWQGNSQLHTINQPRAGDHLAPYWLAETSGCDGCIVPLGFSLPNSSLQEHLVITHAALEKLPIRLLVYKLVFDTLRNDGLRDEIQPLLSPGVRAAMQKTAVGEEILKGFAGAKTETGGSDHAQGETASLQGFAQKPIEDWMVATLGSVFPLWDNRANLRTRLLVDLYELRNRLLGIDASTKRPIIPARFNRNMAALDAILERAKADKIPVLLYVAPIRQDQPLPYDLDAYRR
jgi:hypothetical protein